MNCCRMYGKSPRVRRNPGQAWAHQQSERVSTVLFAGPHCILSARQDYMRMPTYTACRTPVCSHACLKVRRAVTVHVYIPTLLVSCMHGAGGHITSHPTPRITPDVSFESTQ